MSIEVYTEFCFPRQNKTNKLRNTMISILVHKFSEHSHYHLSLYRYRHSVPGVLRLNFTLAELHPVAEITDRLLDYIFKWTTTQFSRRSSRNVSAISVHVIFVFAFYVIIIWIDICSFVGWTNYQAIFPPKIWIIVSSEVIYKSNIFFLKINFKLSSHHYFCEFFE